MAELTEETKKLGLEKLKEVKEANIKAMDKMLDILQTVF